MADTERTSNAQKNSATEAEDNTALHAQAQEAEDTVTTQGVVEEILGTSYKEAAQLPAEMERYSDPAFLEKYKECSSAWFKGGIALLAAEAYLLVNANLHDGNIANGLGHATRAGIAYATTHTGLWLLQSRNPAVVAAGMALASFGAYQSVQSGADLARDMSNIGTELEAQAAIEYAKTQATEIRTELQGLLETARADLTTYNAEYNDQIARFDAQYNYATTNDKTPVLNPFTPDPDDKGIPYNADGETNNDSFGPKVLAEKQAYEAKGAELRAEVQRLETAIEATLSGDAVTLDQAAIDAKKAEVNARGVTEVLFAGDEASAYGLGFIAANPVAAISMEIARWNREIYTGHDKFEKTWLTDILGVKKRMAQSEAFRMLGLNPTEIGKMPVKHTVAMLPTLVRGFMQSPQARLNSVIMRAQMMLEETREGTQRHQAIKDAITYLKTEDGQKKVEETLGSLFSGTELKRHVANDTGPAVTAGEDGTAKDKSVRQRLFRDKAQQPHHQPYYTWEQPDNVTYVRRTDTGATSAPALEKI